MTEIKLDYKKGRQAAERCHHQSNITYCAEISITFSSIFRLPSLISTPSAAAENRLRISLVGKTNTRESNRADSISLWFCPATLYTQQTSRCDPLNLFFSSHIYSVMLMMVALILIQFNSFSFCSFVIIKLHYSALPASGRRRKAFVSDKNTRGPQLHVRHHFIPIVCATNKISPSLWRNN